MTQIIDAATWREINMSLQTYADALDRADCGGILSVFSEDAVWDYRPGAPLRGHADIGKFFAGIGVFAQTSHHVGPPRIGPGPEPGTYESIAYFIATHVLREGGAYTVFGRYLDLFRGKPLRIAHRQVVAHVTEGTDKSYHALARVAR